MMPERTVVGFRDLSPVKAAGLGPWKTMTERGKRGFSLVLLVLFLSPGPPVSLHSSLMVKVAAPGRQPGFACGPFVFITICP